MNDPFFGSADLSTISLATTFYFFVGGVVGVWAARLIVRYDIRAVVTAGALVGGLALAALGQVREQWQLFVVYGVFAAGFALAGLVPMTTVIKTTTMPARNALIACARQTRSAARRRVGKLRIARIAACIALRIDR